jgi:CheY-like chemotaxis protein
MDDEESIRNLLDKILGRIGYEASFARDGFEALEAYTKAKASGRPFSAVICDLTIRGGMGGREAIRELIAIDPQVKAIVSSGYSDDPAMAEYQKYGFRGVIAKPYKINELSHVLQEVIAQGS